MSIRFILLLIFIMLIVVILANIELYINKSNSITTLKLSKKCNVLLPEYTGLADPVYIYNPKNIKRSDLPYKPGYNEQNYVKKKIDEHIASKLSHPLTELGYILRRLTKSNIPIDTLYNAIGKGGVVINTVDPLSSGGLRNYRILTSYRDNVEAFIANGKIYVIKDKT